MRSLLKSWLLVAAPLAAYAAGGRQIGERCDWRDRCVDGLDCKFNRCYNKKCLKREASALGQQMDPVAYRDDLLAEAGITTDDLFDARKTYNDTGFVHSTPYHKFVGVILKHKHEIERMGAVLQFCASPSSIDFDRSNRNLEEGLETGDMVASFFAQELGYLPQEIPEGSEHEVLQNEEAELQAEDVQHLRLLQTTPSPSASPSKTPSAAPTVSKMPTSTPSARPTVPVTTKSYVGFHLEGGAILDGSFSYMYPSDTTNDCILSPDAYSRYCIGFELGLGGEVSLIIMFATNQFNSAVLGESFLFDFDAGFGAHVGAAFGAYFGGTQTDNPNSPCTYEFTFGGGIGIGIFGASACQTYRVCNFDEPEEN